MQQETFGNGPSGYVFLHTHYSALAVSRSEARYLTNDQSAQFIKELERVRHTELKPEPG